MSGNVEGCRFCAGGFAWGNAGNGEFHYTLTHIIKRDGSRVPKPELVYTASTDVFGTEVEIEDAMDIEHCPRCGRRLT